MSVRFIALNSTTAAFRFFVLGADRPGYPAALGGETGLVEADFDVYAVAPGGSLPAFASPISAANYVITERGFGDYDLVFSVSNYFNAAGISSIIITRNDGDFSGEVVARLYYIVGLPQVDVVSLLGTATPAPNVAGVPLVDVKYNLGTVAPAPTVAGIPKVEDATLRATVGTPAGASVSADIAAIKAQTALIDAKTTNLPAAPADETLIIAATTAIMNRVGAPVGASISADIAAVKSSLTTAQTDVTTIKENTARTLGLLHHNARVDKFVFDVDGNLTSARVRVFADAAAFAASTIWDGISAPADGAEGEIYRWTIGAVFADGLPTSFGIPKAL